MINVGDFRMIIDRGQGTARKLPLSEQRDWCRSNWHVLVTSAAVREKLELWHEAYNQVGTQHLGRPSA